MNPEEIEVLLKAIAKSDRRTTDADDVRFWAAMAIEGRWTLATAMRSLVQFRATRPGEWLEPGHLSEIIRAARSRAAGSFVVPKQTQDCEYLPWYRAQLRAHTDRLLAAWAAGESIPDAPTAHALLNPPAAVPVDLPPRPALPPAPTREPPTLASVRPARGNAGAVHFPLLPDGDPDRRAAARAELDAIRAQTPEADPEAGSVAS